MRKSFGTKVLGMALGIAMTFGLVSCSGETKSNEPNYADDEAMSIIANGLEKRFAIVDLNDDEESLRKAVQTEIDTEKNLKERPFKDSKMQEDVITYINLVNDSLDVLNEYSYNSDKYLEEWQKVYDKRTSQIQVLTEKYGLKVSDKYADDFKELTSNDKQVKEQNAQKDAINKLLTDATFEKTDSGYDDGYSIYSAVIENTTSYKFKDISVTIALYDSDNVKTESYIYVQSWAPGEKYRFETNAQVDAAQVKAEETTSK
nr:FxLYD domain-containing protein [Bifidobacterium catenulatum]